MTPRRIEIGQTVKDAVTGLVGQVTGYAQYRFHVDTAYVEGVDSTGRLFCEWLACERLEVVPKA